MSEFVGYVEGVAEAFVLLEAATRGYVRSVKARPTAKDRLRIRPGTTVIFDSTLTGMTRWIDGKSWSPSRFRDGFFVYQEWTTSERGRVQTGLYKKAISTVSPSGQNYHLINYFTTESMDSALTPREFVARLPNGAEVLAAAEKYRYFKCFRTSSQAWRKSYPAPKPASRFEQAKRPVMWDKNPFSPLSAKSTSPESPALPSIRTLDLLGLRLSPALSPAWNEDTRQLALLSHHLLL